MLDGEAGVSNGFSHNDPHHEVCIELDTGKRG